MNDVDPQRCPACGELSITALFRLLGGGFFTPCPNCRRSLRVDPQDGQRRILLAAFGLVGVASIAAVAVTGQPYTIVAAGALACALLYAWEFALTRRSPLEAVTTEGARGYRRNWAIAAIAMLFATDAIAVAATRF